MTYKTFLPKAFNKLTASYEYSCSNRENLLLQIRKQLSEKPEIFCFIFIAFLESTLNLGHVEKKKMSLLG